VALVGLAATLWVGKPSSWILGILLLLLALAVWDIIEDLQVVQANRNQEILARLRSMDETLTRCVAESLEPAIAGLEQARQQTEQEHQKMREELESVKQQIRADIGFLRRENHRLNKRLSSSTQDSTTPLFETDVLWQDAEERVLVTGTSHLLGQLADLIDHTARLGIRLREMEANAPHQLEQLLDGTHDNTLACLDAAADSPRPTAG